MLTTFKKTYTDLTIHTCFQPMLYLALFIKVCHKIVHVYTFIFTHLVFIELLALSIEDCHNYVYTRNSQCLELQKLEMTGSFEAVELLLSSSIISSTKQYVIILY